MLRKERFAPRMACRLIAAVITFHDGLTWQKKVMTDLSDPEARLRRLEQRVDANSSRLESVDSKAGEFGRYRKYQLRAGVIQLIFWLAVVSSIAAVFVWDAITMP
jgi:hypothetical protein